MENEVQQKIPPVQTLPQTPVSVSTPQPTNWSKILLFTVLGLVIVAGSVSLGIQVGKNQTPSKQPIVIQPTTSPTQTVVNPTVQPTINPATNPKADWKTFTNSIYGYQISFQSDWKKLAGPPEENDVLNFRKGDYEIGLSTMTTSYSTIQEYLKQSDKDSQTAWEGTPSIKVISTKLTKINNYSVVQRGEQWLPAGFLKPVINTYFLYKNHVYSITLKYIGNDSDSIQETDAYQRVLSTFEFTN